MSLTNTPAPAQQAVLTGDEIRSIWIEHGLDDEAVEDFARAIESALLSKLRAPVADAKLRSALMEMVECARLHRDAWDAIWSGMSDREQEGRRLQRQHFKRLPKALEAAEAALDAKPWPVEQQPDGTITSVDPADLASAPIAGETQAEQFIQAAIDQAPEPLRRLGEYLSRVLDEDQWATAERMLLGACNAAPQASEAVRDAAFEAVRKQLCKLPRYSFLIGPYGGVKRFADRSGNWIEFDAAHALFDPVSVDAALSAQPGALKNCNCATCRPHTVEIRMILCDVCGNKRCPHAADHRNECVGTGAQNKEPKDA